MAGATYKPGGLLRHQSSTVTRLLTQITHGNHKEFQMVPATIIVLSKIDPWDFSLPHREFNVRPLAFTGTPAFQASLRESHYITASFWH